VRVKYKTQDILVGLGGSQCIPFIPYNAPEGRRAGLTLDGGDTSDESNNSPLDNWKIVIIAIID
jgi:hypothetical protein